MHAMQGVSLGGLPYASQEAMLVEDLLFLFMVHF